MISPTVCWAGTIIRPAEGNNGRIPRDPGAIGMRTVKDDAMDETTLRCPNRYLPGPLATGRHGPHCPRRSGVPSEGGRLHEDDCQRTIARGHKHRGRSPGPYAPEGTGSINASAVAPGTDPACDAPVAYSRRSRREHPIRHQFRRYVITLRHRRHPQRVGPRSLTARANESARVAPAFGRPHHPAGA